MLEMVFWEYVIAIWIKIRIKCRTSTILNDLPRFVKILVRHKSWVTWSKSAPVQNSVYVVTAIVSMNKIEKFYLVLTWCDQNLKKIIYIIKILKKFKSRELLTNSDLWSFLNVNECRIFASCQIFKCSGELQHVQKVP